MASENRLGVIEAMKKEWDTMLVDTDRRKKSLSKGVLDSEVIYIWIHVDDTYVCGNTH
jgi:hypothetical protein